MSKDLPLFVKITFLILVITFSQAVTTLAQRNTQNTVAGEKTYIARPMPFDAPVGIGNVDAALKTGASDIKGFAAVGTTGLITCTTQSGHDVEKVQYAYRLYLDEESLESSLTTNQRSRTASFKLVGRMRIWQQEFITNSPGCETEVKEINGGGGGLDVTMTNKQHVTPLNFMAAAASGRVYGPGISDSVSITSGSNPPTYINSIDTGYVKKLIPKQNQQLSLEALKKMGIKLPPGYEEQLKQSQQIQTNIPDHRMDGIMRGSSKDKSVAFMITAGFDADMMVYKPKAMASSGGGASALASSSDSRSPFFNNSFIRNANYVSGGNETANVSEVSIQQNEGNGLFIPRRNRDKVQAFVNLDNDNKDETFDLYDKEKIADKDNDMVKVILRVKEKPRFQRKGVATFKVAKGEQYVKVWERDFSSGSTNFDKLREYRPREMKESDFREFRNPKTSETDLKGFIIKEFWIEGIDPQEAQKGTKFEFKYYENGKATGTASEEEDFDLTVIGIKSIEWKGEGNSYKSDNNLDEDPNHRMPSATMPRTAFGTCGGATSKILGDGAVRVFPGRRMQNGSLSPSEKNRVSAEVTLSVDPVEPVKIYFDSFDVDDPHHSVEPKNEDTPEVLDDEESSEDNRGNVEGSKSGKFRDEKDGILVKEFVSKTGIIQFNVTMQPGDNFRIVGFGDKDFFENLENDDTKLNKGGSEDKKAEEKQKIVDKYILEKKKVTTSAEIRYEKKYTSKVLTVWRFLYSEVDYMGPRVGENKIDGTVYSVKPNSPKNGETTITVNEGLADKYAQITNISKWGGSDGVINAFQEGRLELNGSSYWVKYSSNNSVFRDTIVVSGTINNVSSGTIYTLYEDDEKMGFTPQTDLRNIPGRQPIQSDNNFAYCQSALRYQPAYIVPDFLTLNTDDLNKTKTVKFVRNVKSVNDKYDFSLFEFDNKAYHQRKDFWTVYVLFAYKGATYEDGDPDGKIWNSGASLAIADTTAEKSISGIADTINGTGIFIFVEGCIERNAGNQADMTGTAKGEKDTVVHELGHILGAEHEDGGMMASPDPLGRFFSNKSLLAFRKLENP